MTGRGKMTQEAHDLTVCMVSSCCRVVPVQSCEHAFLLCGAVQYDEMIAAVGHPRSDMLEVRASTAVRERVMQSKQYQQKSAFLICNVHLWDLHSL